MLAFHAWPEEKSARASTCLSCGARNPTVVLTNKTQAEIDEIKVRAWIRLDPPAIRDVLKPIPYEPRAPAILRESHAEACLVHEVEGGRPHWHGCRSEQQAAAHLAEHPSPADRRKIPADEQRRDRPAPDQIRLPDLKKGRHV